MDTSALHSSVSVSGELIVEGSRGVGVGEHFVTFFDEGKCEE